MLGGCWLILSLYVNELQLYGVAGFEDHSRYPSGDWC